MTEARKEGFLIMTMSCGEMIVRSSDDALDYGTDGCRPVWVRPLHNAGVRGIPWEKVGDGNQG